MGIIQFANAAKSDPDLASLLQEVADEMRSQVLTTEPQQYTLGGADIAFAAAAYALYRWIKDHFDHHRALNETAILKQQEEVIASLINDGFPPEQAHAVATALLDRIAKRGQDDPVLKTASALIGKGA